MRKVKVSDDVKNFLFWLAVFACFASWMIRQSKG